ncbi:hypothetical protein [Nonomuraea sp. SYSU D8015]|uniref:hypothetical protein n=1 Tax=Nonomuraea sp. SYSU D8015 TaxID=2593644 RepID=UPI0016609511|nr:hypothetical protein [Nonomuraea sp. SYSU D8015]
MMIGGRMLMESPALDVELMALKRRVTELEEQIRMLNAANLALVRAMEALNDQIRLPPVEDRLARTG